MAKRTSPSITVASPATGAAAGPRRSASPEQHGAVDHDAIAGLHALGDREQALVARARRDLAPLEPAGGALHEHHRRPVLERHSVGGRARRRVAGPPRRTTAAG